MSRYVLGLDVGSNSVGSAWYDRETGSIVTGVSVFPAGVEESDEKRGDPKNAKRRMARRTRITLARRARRKHELRRKLIETGLLPPIEACDPCSSKDVLHRSVICCFKALLESTDPWELRRRGLDESLTPFEFGRVLLHLAQRRGALGLHVPDSEESETDAGAKDDGKVKAAIGAVRGKMQEKNARTFGEFIAMIRDERVTSITTEDHRPVSNRKGPREWRSAVRNKAASYEHCADRWMIRDEFAKLWEAQVRFGAETADLLTPELRLTLDDPDRKMLDSDPTVSEEDRRRYRHTFREGGLLFRQRRQSWDLGTLGRCTLHPADRCVPVADMYASQYLVVETVNNLRIIEHGKKARPLSPEERGKIKAYLSGPLGTETRGKRKGQPKRTVSVNDLRNLMGTAEDGWGRASKTSRFRFNIENDEDRSINTDWFSREIIHGAVTLERWKEMPERIRNGLNRAILKFDPNQERDAENLKKGVMRWAGLTDPQATALVAAWKARPSPDAKRLSMSRRAVRNLLAVMDRSEAWDDPKCLTCYRWLTQIEARKSIAGDSGFRDVTTGEPLDAITRHRYATGAQGATASDRHYMKKHPLTKNGSPIIDPETDKLLAQPPPAPLISNPVVRKAIHEVRRHLIEYMKTFGRKPDEVYIELAREARMGKKHADRLLFRNRLRNRIRNDIIREFDLDSRTSTQQRAACDRVVLRMQQSGVCPLCGQGEITSRQAATGEGCEVAHIVPRASGGHDGLSNIVIAHTRCNREMGRRTPREYWSKGEGFERGMVWVEGIYGEVKRPHRAEVSSASGDSLWACYFTKRDDRTKIEQFKKDVKDVQEMTPRQEAATKYAARQVMAYISDALYDGKGLPERSTGGDSQERQRRIFTTDGFWTSRFRREWSLYFDPHGARSHSLEAADKHERQEKNRGDHRHHAIDALITALCTRQVQVAWEDRERQADRDGVNTADQEAMENYRRLHLLHPPAPFKTREEFREAVQRAVFGNEENPRPICHRPVKRKLSGALHKASQYGPVLDTRVQGNIVRPALVDGRVTIRQDVLGEARRDYLKPKHLRMPCPESNEQAVGRLSRRFRIGKRMMSEKDAKKAAWRLVKSKAFTRKQVDPDPNKGGIVRDVGLRRCLRKQIQARGLNPGSYSKAELKRSIDSCGPLTQESGVPIHSVILLWSNSDPVTIQRTHVDYRSGEQRKLSDPATLRLYDSQNNHHIEIRVNDKGDWSGKIVRAFDAAQRKLARLHALRKASIPKPEELRRLSAARRRRFSPCIRAIEEQNPIVDRRDDNDKGGVFIMSLCEGEMLHMKHKNTLKVGYFVVAKLDRPNRVVVVPHWDARGAKERKNAAGSEIHDSKREQLSLTPNDLKRLVVPGKLHARKVRVSALGRVQFLERD